MKMREGWKDREAKIYKKKMTERERKKKKEKERK